MIALPAPAVVESYLDNSRQPPLQVWRLHWDPDTFGRAERCWYLPRHLTLKGQAPERFGLSLLRRDADSYAVHLLWNEMSLNWTNLTRVQLLTSALSPLSRALGLDLWQLLNQPQSTTAVQPPLAA